MGELTWMPDAGLVAIPRDADGWASSPPGMILGGLPIFPGLPPLLEEPSQRGQHQVEGE